MEIRHPVEGLFGSEFSTMCNHCGVMAAWSRKTLKFCEKFVLFRKKRPLTVKFSKRCSESFHWLTDRRCCVQISWNLADEKLAKLGVIYGTKNFPCLSNCRCCTDRAPKKSVRVSRQQFTQSAPDFIKIGSFSAELYSRTPPNRALKWVQYSAA